MNKVLVLGGYGNFGWRIALALSKAGISCIIAGRNENKAKQVVKELHAEFPNASLEISIFDVKNNLDDKLRELRPTVVINTCGPFQMADYAVAEACIRAKAHYIDLADGRDFVNNIVNLNNQAKANNVLIVSGASTVPTLSSAVLEKYKDEFSVIESLVFGIAPGQKAPRGFATTKAILSYVGKPLKPFAGVNKAYGWQDIYLQDYPELGKRWMANCDVPDLDLLPQHYGIKSIRFSAGMENSALHLGIWLVSWMVRIGIPLNLPRYAYPLWKFADVFNIIGSKDGGMHMLIRGKNHLNQPHERKWFIIGKDNDGPNIPTIPAVILTKKILTKQLVKCGAVPCVAMVTLEEYMKELKGFAIEQFVL